MFWLVFALLAAVATAGYRVVTRHVMKGHSPYAYALMVNIVGAFFTLPLIWTDFTFAGVPRTLFPWLLVALAAALWAMIMVLAFKSIKLLPVSRREQISQVEVLFVLLLAISFLGEALTWLKAAGAVFVIAGALVAASGRTSIYSGWKSKGVALTVGVAALYALVAIVDKEALAYFPTGLYTFMQYIFPGIILAFGLSRRRAWSETKSLISHKGWVLLGATALSVTSYYSGLRAYDLADASVVYPVLKLATIVAVVGGLLFFKEERVHMPRKLVASVLVVAGAVLSAL
jgi:drug/metabolite transporter (DMT)-like permease